MKNTTKKQNNRTRVITLRLTTEEYVQVEQTAQGVPIGPYIRSKILNYNLPKIKTRKRKPIKDDLVLGQILGKFGQDGIAPNLQIIAKGIEIGLVDFSDDTEAEVLQGCQDIAEIKTLLIKALGLQPVEDGHDP